MDSDAPSIAPVLLTGVTGYLGRGLARRLLERGCRVQALYRSPWTGAPEIPPAQRFRGSLPGDIPEAMFEGIDTVVHSAWTGVGTDAAAHAANIEGALELAEAARTAGVRRFIFNSSIVARVDAPSSYGRAKYEAEQQLLALERLEVVVLRPGEIIGPRARGLIPRMIELVDRPAYKPVPMSPEDDWLQPIHIDDLCQAECLVLEGRVRGPCTLHLADPEGIRLADFIQLVSRARRGRSAWLLRLPRWLLRRGASPLPRVASAADLARLGLALRPVAESVASAVASYETRSASSRS